MRQWLLGLSCALALLACSKAPPPVTGQSASAGIDWIKPTESSVEAIFAQANAANKAVFLYWGAVWCPPCNQVKASVFARQDFIAQSRLFVPVYLDGDTPGAQKLGARFKVRGYPTMILFKPDGTEVTRLPGEIDPERYMEMLQLGLTSGNSVKSALAAALGPDKATLSAQDWRMLAYYSWDQDQAQLVLPAQRASTLEQLALACPSSQPEVAARLALRAIAAFAQNKAALPDPAGALVRVQQLLADTALARSNLDLLVNEGDTLVAALTAADSAERRALQAAWLGALQQLSADPALSQPDRLSLLAAKLSLQKLAQGKRAPARFDAVLLSEVRAAVASAEQTSRSAYERQAVIPAAADLLSQAGLLDESDQLLKAELPKALAPYYHMLVLAANAKTRGDKRLSLHWAEQAWGAAKGSATRLQWGSGFVSKLIELAPNDVMRIEKAATGVLGELGPKPEMFYERNRRSLEKMAQQLLHWRAPGRRAKTLQRLSAQLDALCRQLPQQDDARAACAGVFKPREAAAKT